MLTLNPPNNPQWGTLSVPISQMKRLRLPEDKPLVCSHVEWNGRARSWTLICLRVNDYECFPPVPLCPGTGKPIAKGTEKSGQREPLDLPSVFPRAKSSVVRLAVHRSKNKNLGWPGQRALWGELYSRIPEGMRKLCGKLFVTVERPWAIQLRNESRARMCILNVARII